MKPNSAFEQVAGKIVGNSLRERTQKKKTIKSPLRYPGGKSRAVNQVLGLLPQGLDTLCSPFVGGASVELACASERRIRVYGYDAFLPVVNFWQEVLKNPKGLAEQVRKYYPLSRTQFYALQKRYASLTNKQELASAFFVLNRSSFSGTTLSGGMSPGHPRFTENSIDRLQGFSINNFTVEHADFSESIPRHSNDFMYLDPPYANGGNLYGDKGDHHTGFDHEKLASILTARDGWLLSYNDCEQVRDLYSGFKSFRPSWTYGMSNDKKSNEILILSKDYAAIQ